MYRICKVLNHNGVIALDMKENKEYVLLGKGVGFGKKVGERLEQPEECTVYSLQETSSRGAASELARSIEPEYLEMANQILNLAREQFGTIDQSILFPMADHIEFAVKRMQKGEQISNPLTQDIKTLFYGEFKVALTLKERLKKEKGIDDYTGTYTADYANFSGTEYLFGGTSIKREAGKELSIDCTLEITEGTAKVFWISGSDEAVTLIEATGTYSDTITLPDGGNYIGIECENFTGNIELNIE